MEYIEIEVINWAKHQPRKDVKRPSWFALSNGILTDPKVFSLDAQEFKALIYFFCLASQSNSARVTVHFDLACRILNIPVESVRTAIDKLTDAGVTSTLRPRVARVRKRTATDRQTDTTDRQTGALPVLTDTAPSVNPAQVYCELWKARNGKRPPFGDKEAGQLKRLSASLGPERVAELIRIFFSMPDPFFIKKGYDVSTFILNTTAIAQFEANGKIVTRAAVEQIEKHVDKIQGTKKRRSIAELEQERAAMMADAQAQLPAAGDK